MTRTYNVIDSDGHVLDPPPISGSTTSIRSIATALPNSSSILTARPTQATEGSIATRSSQMWSGGNPSFEHDAEVRGADPDGAECPAIRFCSSASVGPRFYPLFG